MKHVICLGSSRGNDRLGWDIAAALQRDFADRRRADIRVQVCATPAQLPGMLEGASALLIIDAVAGLPPGSVRRLTPADLQSAPAWSSHGIDLVAALGLADALGELPARVDILGIGAGDPACAADDAARVSLEPLLPAVRAAVAELFGP